MKNSISIYMRFVLGIVVFLSFCMCLKSEGIPDDSWPKSWFKDLRSASSYGLKTFNEAPELAEQVKKGKLPPVAERLPDDPVVVEPFDKIGVYGGTLKVFNEEAYRMIVAEPPVSMNPQVNKVVLNYATSVTIDNQSKVYTIKLRPGMRWSDGAIFSSADFLWYHDNIRMNKDLMPMLLKRFKGLTVEAPDPLTVVYRFAKPYAFFMEELAHRGESYISPGHFHKKYHPNFRDPKELDAEAKDKGYINWQAYFKAKKKDDDNNIIKVPAIRAYVLTSLTPTVMQYERNPYYHKVDPQGNQLPYIDNIQVQLVNTTEVKAAKASTGQVDLCCTIGTEDIPLFKVGEKKCGYTTYMWVNIYGVDVVFQPNLTVEKPKLRKIFRDSRFRKALSLSIDRDELNEIIYFGHGTPRNTTLIPSSRYYEPKFATAYIQYNTKKANALFDDMGLKDVDGDGLREYADGSPLTFTIEWLDIEGTKKTTVELVVSHWRKVGINAVHKQINANLQWARARANAMDMTVWHADRSTDILFPMLPGWYVPMHISWDDAHWSLWSHWYISEGERGEKPPAYARQLMDWWDEMKASGDPKERIKLGKKILNSQAENVWSIGTIGLSPKPLIVSDRLHNVCKKGYYGWDNQFFQAYHPSTWFLKEERKK